MGARNFIDSKPEKHPLISRRNRILRNSRSTSESGVSRTSLICCIEIPKNGLLSQTTYVEKISLSLLKVGVTLNCDHNLICASFLVKDTYIALFWIVWLEYASFIRSKCGKSTVSTHLIT